MFTSCCPGWVRFLKGQFPSYTENLSTAKSPQQMFGAVAKSYFAQKLGVDPHKIFVVSIMPCTAKKAEAARPELVKDGERLIDLVLTSQELAMMITEAGIDFKNVKVDDKDGTLADEAVKAAVDKCTAELGDGGRVLLRKSGTEPVLRVMAEAGTLGLCERMVDAIIDSMDKSGHLLEVKK